MNSKFSINYNLQYLFVHPYMSKYCKLWLTWNLEVINIYLLCCNWTSLHTSQQSAVGNWEWDEGPKIEETGFDSRHRVRITSLSTVTRLAVE